MEVLEEGGPFQFPAGNGLMRVVWGVVRYGGTGGSMKVLGGGPIPIPCGERPHEGSVGSGAILISFRTALSPDAIFFSILTVRVSLTAS